MQLDGRGERSLVPPCAPELNRCSGVVRASLDGPPILPYPPIHPDTPQPRRSSGAFFFSPVAARWRRHTADGGCARLCMTRSSAYRAAPRPDRIGAWPERRKPLDRLERIEPPPSTLIIGRGLPTRWLSCSAGTTSTPPSSRNARGSTCISRGGRRTMLQIAPRYTPITCARQPSGCGDDDRRTCAPL
jgi:hypothetical protein